MNRIAFIIISIVFNFWLNGCQAQKPYQNQAMQLGTTITLPNVHGRIDHLTFDSKNSRIFVAALGNNTVEVVDLKTSKVIHTIKGLSEPQGIVYIPESNTVFVSNGGDGECIAFDADTFKKTASIKLEGDGDNVRCDAIDKRIYVGYGNGGIAIIDTKTYKLIADVKITGHPESFQIDRTANRIYVNVPDERQIEVIDIEKQFVVEKWKMTIASSNFPMCLDEPNHRLFIGCRHQPKLLVIDTQTGKTISSYDIDRDIDDIFFDAPKKQIYLSCGGGYVDVFTQKDPNTYISADRISSCSGARTSLFVPELNQLIVASPSGINADAALFVYNLK
jgi:YVTN family beta-propeller protein